MADITLFGRVPTHWNLLNPTLDAIRALGGSASIKEIDDQVTQQLDLSSGVTQVPHGNGRQTELEYRLGWARTYLKKYGLINNSERGVWSLTVLGHGPAHIDPDEVRRTVRTAVQRGQNKRQQSAHEAAPTDEPDGEIEDPTLETASWRENLLHALLEMSPAAVERVCQGILRVAGFIEGDVTGRSGDGGIDGSGIIRLAGLISFPVLFQCKRYSSNVSAGVVRDFRGAMTGRADKGSILTTGGFTREAQREATRDGAPPIDLIDGDLLINKLRELKLGVHTRMVEVVEVNRDWFSSI